MLESLFNKDEGLQACEYCEIFKNTLLYRTPPVAAVGSCQTEWCYAILASNVMLKPSVKLRLSCVYSLRTVTLQTRIGLSSLSKSGKQKDQTNYRIKDLIKKSVNHFSKHHISWAEHAKEGQNVYFLWQYSNQAITDKT